MLEEKRGSRKWRRGCSLGEGKILITPSPRKVEYFCRSETRVLVVNEKVAIIGGWGRFWGSCKAKYNWRARMRGKMRMRGCLITCCPWRMGRNVLGGLDYLEFLETSPPSAEAKPVFLIFRGGWEGVILSSFGINGMVETPYCPLRGILTTSSLRF